MLPDSQDAGRGYTRDTVLLASRDQASTTVGGEAIILGMADGIYYGLEGAGARIWALLQERRTMGSVVDHIVAEFEVDGARAWDDLCSLAADLVARGLVERDPPPTP